MGFGRDDSALLVMPMCHANSLYFAGAFTYTGASTFVYSMKSVDPEHLLRTLAQSGATFTSLVPTHYIMMLALPDEKWGERVHAVIVLHNGADASQDEIIAWCRDKIAGYKRPRSISFIKDDEMPRTATGKILHRVLRTQMGGG
jgi:acyl-CoA synthetase (AMP-forming)/AMP-acid ligase II